MASTNPSQLFLLADHVKLSLLERQRAVSMNLEPNSHDGQISRSLDTLGSGIEALENQLVETPDSALNEQVTTLRTQHSDMLTQFRGSAEHSSPTTITSPNSASLAPDFSAALSSPRPPARSRQSQTPKSVRFKDDTTSHSRSPSPDANRSALFPYRDNPDDSGYRDEDDETADQSHLSNQQIHAYHSNVLRDQDDQLDALSTSIGRQRELSLAIGDELDDQAVMLDGVEDATDRHQGQLDRARGRLGKVARKAKENWGMTTIIVLIVVLVFLIIILK